MNTAEQLARLADELAEAKPPQGSPAALFVSGVRRWLDGSVETLDEALEVKGAPGIEGARTLYRRRQRDSHLLTAWRLLEGSPTSRAKQLAEAIGRFDADIWPRWRHLETPPHGCSALRAALWSARRHGELPRSVNQLLTIARRAVNDPY